MTKRMRDFGIGPGTLACGSLNAITDVAGVAVGHTTLIEDGTTTVRTGVTIIVPQPDILERDYYAGVHVLNGSGEMTGAMWIAESGLLSSPIALTSTHALGTVRDALPKIADEQGRDDRWWLATVAETYDGWLNDGARSPISVDHVRQALDSATTGRVIEGGVGGGTGMICHGFKGGIGTASRLVDIEGQSYTVGVLVQANYGLRHQLTIDGLRVGERIDADIVPTPERSDVTGGSSIIVVIATDAPLIGTQCERLARRASIGLARTGGIAHDGSGDIFLAFSTANSVDPANRQPFPVTTLPNATMNGLFAAVADSTEEAIINAILAGEDMTGRKGRRVCALPHHLLEKLLSSRSKPSLNGG